MVIHVNRSAGVCSVADQFIAEGVVRVKRIAVSVSVTFNVSQTGEIQKQFDQLEASRPSSAGASSGNDRQTIRSARNAVDTVLAVLSAHLKQLVPDSGHSIMELEGLGKEIWQNIDAQEYVRRERSSWNG